MPWNDITFVECQTLTASNMNSIMDDFASMAAQDSGSPLITFPNSILTANAGIRTTATGSFGHVHANSGVATLGVGSFGHVHANSGVATLGVGSFASINVDGNVEAGSGFHDPGVSSFGTTEVESNVSVFGGLRMPHFMLRYNPGNPPTVARQTNVSCLQRHNTGTYEIHLAQSFTNSLYFLLSNNHYGDPGNSARLACWRQESSNLNRILIVNIDLALSGLDTGGVGTTWIGIGD